MSIIDKVKIPIEFSVKNSSKLREAKKRVEALKSATGEVAEGLDNLDESTRDYERALDELGEELQFARGDLQHLASEFRDLGKVTDEFGDIADETTGDATELSEALAEIADDDIVRGTRQSASALETLQEAMDPDQATDETKEQIEALAELDEESFVAVADAISEVRELGADGDGQSVLTDFAREGTPTEFLEEYLDNVDDSIEATYEFSEALDELQLNNPNEIRKVFQGLISAEAAPRGDEQTEFVNDALSRAIDTEQISELQTADRLRELLNRGPLGRSGSDAGIGSFVPQTVASNEPLTENPDVSGDPQTFLGMQTKRVLNNILTQGTSIDDLREMGGESIAEFVTREQAELARRNDIDEEAFDRSNQAFKNTVTGAVTNIIQDIANRDDADELIELLQGSDVGIRPAQEAFREQAIEQSPVTEDTLREDEERQARNKTGPISRIIELYEESDQIRSAIDSLEDPNVTDPFEDLPMDDVEKVFDFFAEFGNEIGGMEPSEFSESLDARRTLQDLMNAIDEQVLSSSVADHEQLNQFQRLTIAEAISDINPALLSDDASGGSEQGQPVTRELFAAELLDKFNRAESDAERSQIQQVFSRFRRGDLGLTRSLIQMPEFQSRFQDELRNNLTGSVGLMKAEEIAAPIQQELSKEFELSDEPMRLRKLLEEDPAKVMDIVSDAVPSGKLADPSDRRDVIETVQQTLRDAREASVIRGVPGVSNKLEDTQFTLGDIHEQSSLEQISSAMDRQTSQSNFFRGGPAGEFFAKFVGPGGGEGGFGSVLMRTADDVLGGTVLGTDGKLSAGRMKTTKRAFERTKDTLENMIPVLGATSANLGPLNIALGNAGRRVLDLTALLGPLTSALLGFAGAAGTAGGALGGFVAAGAVGYFERMAESMAGVKDRSEAMQKFFSNLKRAAIDAIEPLQNAQLGGSGIGSQTAFIETVRASLRLLNRAAELGRNVVELDSVARAVERIQTALFTGDGNGPTLASALEQLTNDALPLITDALVAVINGLPEFLAFLGEVTRVLGPELTEFFARVSDLLPSIIAFGLGFLKMLFKLLNAILGVVQGLRDLVNMLPFAKNEFAILMTVLGGLIGSVYALSLSLAVLATVFGPLISAVGTLQSVMAGLNLVTGGYLATLVPSISLTGALSSAIGTLTGAVAGLSAGLASLLLVGVAVVGFLADMAFYAKNGESALTDLLPVVELLYDILLTGTNRSTDPLTQWAIEKARAVRDAFLDAYQAAKKFFSLLGQGTKFGSDVPDKPGTPQNQTNNPYASNGTQFGGAIIINNNGVIGQRDLGDMIRREIDNYVSTAGGRDI